jgi:hypothetical protein
MGQVLLLTWKSCGITVYLRSILKVGIKREFLSALGMTSADADKLREILLLAAAVNNEVSMTSADKFGCRYTLDVPVSWGSRDALVRSAWIIKTGEDFPRLVCCYVLRGSI